MNSNNKDKVKDFFRKEGFYFVLFICLCVIATVVVFTVNKNNKAKEDAVTPDCRHKCNGCGINTTDLGRGLC